MRIYNSLSRQTEEFKPTDPKRVLMYCCGPTVYRRAHIGNFRTYTMADVLHRVLKANGFGVKYIMNITDVGHLTGDNLGDSSIGEDRIEIEARRESLSAWDIADKYIDIFKKDYSSLNLLPPETFVRATDTINEQITLIQRLEKKGYTYNISDGVYFDTSKVNNYGTLSDIDEMGMGNRLVKNNEKRNDKDFALWKFNLSENKRHMEWDSPWGRGFPGWHIECSAICMKSLGEAIDIHCGGEDLKSTHHPNETVQSEAVTNKIFSKYWMHVAFVLINGKKMSKSLKNTLSLNDIYDKGADPTILKYLYYNTHYRKLINVTDESLSGAQSACDRLRRVVREGMGDAKREDLIKSRYEEFMSALSDDLDTPNAIAILWMIVRDNSMTSQQKAITIAKCGEVLGLYFVEKKNDPMTNTHIRQLVNNRDVARQNKNWGEADRIRKILEDMGLRVIDTDERTKIEYM